MRRAATTILLILITAIPLAAEDLLVDYVEGTLEIQEGLGWFELYIGDTVPENSTIRLSDDGFVELSTRTVTVTLSDDGTYDTRSLLQSGRKIASWSIGSVVSNRLDRLINPPQKGEVAGLGSRAERKTQDLPEMSDPFKDSIKDGKQLLGSNLFDEAISMFQEAADEAVFEEEIFEARFYEAYAHSLKGDNTPALKILKDMQPDSNAGIFTEYVLLKGKLLIENLAFADALELFSEYLKHPDMGETTQVVYFLMAVCHQALDDDAQAEKFLRDAINIDASSEYGRAAQRMLQSL
jgi:tetratricopeptide (TPR) repeat protein